MNARQYPIERLVEAGADAAVAQRLVGLLRAASLAGAQHDPDLFDAAVIYQRRAQRTARMALETWARSRPVSLARSGQRTAPEPSRLRAA